jgi:hypothetical protein
MAEVVDEGAAPIPFHAWLEQHRYGRASMEWADRLADVLQAVKTHGKKGQLKIVIDISPSGSTVVITDRLEGKIPEADREASIYFVDKTGSPVKDDPNQFRATTIMVEGRPKLVMVDPSTGEIVRDLDGNHEQEDKETDG